MSLPRPSEGKAPSQLKEGVAPAAAEASTSSSWNNRLNTFPPLSLHNKNSKIGRLHILFLCVMEHNITLISS